MRRQEAVGLLAEPLGELLRPGGIVEGLHLDEELVHDPAGALAHHRPVDREGTTSAGRHGAHATPRHGDGIDLLDEADGTAFAAGLLAEGLEEGADLAGGGPVPHRLEGGRRDEQERHPRLLGHGLRHVRLAGAGWPLEQHPTAGTAPHANPVGLVVGEHLEGVADLVRHLAEADHVIEGDVDVLGRDDRVRRPSVAEHRQQDDRPQQQHDGDARQPEHGIGRQGELGEDRLPGEEPPPQPACGDGEDEAEARQALLSISLALRRPIGHGSTFRRCRSQ